MDSEGTPISDVERGRFRHTPPTVQSTAAMGPDVSPGFTQQGSAYQQVCSLSTSRGTETKCRQNRDPGRLARDTARYGVLRMRLGRSEGVTRKRGDARGTLGHGRIRPHKWRSVPGASQGVTWPWGPLSQGGFHSGVGVRQAVLNGLRPRIHAGRQPHKWGLRGGTIQHWGVAMG